MSKALAMVPSLLYSSSLSLLFAMKIPPLLIHPGLTPVSSSNELTKLTICDKSWISTSLGRSRQTKPAVCQVVPAVSWSFSSKTVLVTPRLAKWYNVWHPRLPPPIIYCYYQAKPLPTTHAKETLTYNDHIGFARRNLYRPSCQTFFVWDPIVGRRGGCSALASVEATRKTGGLKRRKIITSRFIPFKYETVPSVVWGSAASKERGPTQPWCVNTL